MHKAALITLLAGALCACTLSACTFSENIPIKQGGEVIQGSVNQPHLPPPDVFSPDNISPDNISQDNISQDVSNQTTLCGSRGLNNVCGASEFCRYDIADNCGAADKPGTCTPIRQICTKEYRPVCGCDGNTYGNACGAQAKGVSVKSLGECP